MNKNFEVSFISDRIKNRMIVAIIDGSSFTAFNLKVDFKNARPIQEKKKSSEFMSEQYFHYSRDLPGIGYKPGKA